MWEAEELRDTSPAAVAAVCRWGCPAAPRHSSFFSTAVPGPSGIQASLKLLSTFPDSQQQLFPTVIAPLVYPKVMYEALISAVKSLLLEISSGAGVLFPLLNPNG